MKKKNIKSGKIIEVQAPSFYVNKSNPSIVSYEPHENDEDWLYVKVGSETASSPAPMKENDWLYFYEKRIAIVDMSPKTKSDRELLLEANGIIRSFYSVCERKGKDTNWEALTKRVKSILEEQHPIIKEDIRKSNKLY